MTTVEAVAIVGAGIIGTSWSVVFARAGLRVCVHDGSSDARATLAERVADMAAASGEDASRVRAIAGRVAAVDRLEQAVSGAAWVQECIPERLELKAALFAQLDGLAHPDTILASSTSSLPISSFTGGLSGLGRCIVVHPATPPHLLPVVEIVPAAATSPEVTRRAVDMMRRVGQSPVLIEKETPGFVMNRLQGALIGEMLRLIEEGVVSPEGADRIISDGFGLRWPFLGPLEGVDLNAPGGIADYLARYGRIFDDLARERGGAAVVTPAVVARLDADLRSRVRLEDLPQRTRERDRRIAALRTLRRELGAETGTFDAD